MWAKGVVGLGGDGNGHGDPHGVNACIGGNLCQTNKWAKNNASDGVGMHHVIVLGFSGVTFK